jgi:hypothetical protein
MLDLLVPIVDLGQKHAFNRAGRSHATGVTRSVNRK